MNHLYKIFKLPGPKDLGMSDSNNAMPSRLFPNKPGEVTWENYEEKLAELYPVKFFLAHTLPHFFRRVWWRASRPFEDAWYWFQCHFLPSHQYHWLDLREPKTQPSPYRYGWLDTNRKMELAMFSCLCYFVEREDWSRHVPSEEDAAKDDGINLQYSGYKRQLADHKEYMAIYQWWTKDRHVESAEESALLDLWHKAHLICAPNANDLHKEMRDIEERNKAKMEEMLQRLLKIRHIMWT
jgi:hypothetical protein